MKIPRGRLNTGRDGGSDVRMDAVMREVSLRDLLVGLEGVRIVSGDIDNTTVRGITEDSRLVENDWLFIARKGERFDGRSFIDKAIERGAAA